MLRYVLWQILGESWLSGLRDGLRSLIGSDTYLAFETLELS